METFDLFHFLSCNLIVPPFHKQAAFRSSSRPPLSSVIFPFVLLYLASCVCFPLHFVWHVSNVPLSTQQNSLRLCCSCFHRNVISSLQPGQSVSLAMVARQYLCPFSLLHCSCGELRPEREKCLGSLDSCQHTSPKKKLTFRANQRLKQQTHNGAVDGYFLGV